jgi:N-methylhydantoinase A
VLSGPAGGVVGAAAMAQRSGFDRIIGFDMGGTSTDVALVAGTPRASSEAEVAGFPVRVPMLDIHTVGAGGGSLARFDAAGALRVGPESAGADPGPICYGRGTQPTVTDANLLLGYLAPENPLAGGVSLDREAAREAVGRLASELGLEPLVCAEGIVRVANAEMLRALRVVTVERGIDPRRYALLAFGGAGPLHAAAIASELGIGRIVCPRSSGVLAALGLVVSQRRRDAQRTVLLSGDRLSSAVIAEVVEELSERAREALGKPAADIDVVYELRYRGQSFELAVAAGAHPAPQELRQRFEAQHEERYGYHAPGQELELVTIRVSATVPGADIELTGADEAEPAHARREATLDGERVELEVLRGSPAPGTEIAGAMVVELPESTLLVPPGWAGTVDDTGTIQLRAR